jgi:hypothetical protein
LSNEGLDLLPKKGTFTGEQESPEASFLTPKYYTYNTAQHIAPLIDVANPGLDTWIVIEVR